MEERVKLMLHCSPPSARTIQSTTTTHRFTRGTRFISHHVEGSKQSSSRNKRGQKLRPGHTFVLVAVGIWLMYQLVHVYKRRAAAVEISGNNGVHGLGRKSLIKFAGVSSGEDAAGISGGGIVAGNDDAVEWKPRTSKGRDEEDDGLFGYDDGDYSDFHLENGEGEENDGLDRSAVRQVNSASGAQKGATQLLNAAEDGIDIGPERNNS